MAFFVDKHKHINIMIENLLSMLSKKVKYEGSEGKGMFFL